MVVSSIRQHFQEWYASDLGQQVLSKEVALIEQHTLAAVGYYMMIQTPLKSLVLSQHHLRHTLMLAPFLELGAPDNTLVGLSHELPIDSDGIDVHVMHHSLDLSLTPHDDLREAARTLLPSGKIIIVGFNPYSLWGIRKVFSRRRSSPWNAAFISPKRLEDWLKVAGLTLEAIDYLVYQPPFKNLQWYQRGYKVDQLLSATKLPLSGVYIITATKQTRSHISNRLRWKRPAMRVTTLTKPTVKEIQE